MKFRIVVLLLSLLALAAPALPAAETDEDAAPKGETLTERSLKDVVARQKELFAKAAREGDQLDEARFHGEAQAIATSYDVLIQKNPTFAPAYVAYGVFLGKVGMTKQAVAILLQANKLDPNIALVKNQLAKHLAEDGKPLDALPWIMSAIDLEPKEPLYHFQLGQLLLAARDDFITSGSFTRDGLNKAMIEAFQRAAELAPNDLSLAYQVAKAYYELEPPRWDEALAAWEKLENRSGISAEQRQLIRLQKSNVLLKLGRRDEARQALATITDLKLATEKQTLLDQMAPKADK